MSSNHFLAKFQIYSFLTKNIFLREPNAERLSD